ncbi:MAG: hypothetical protein HY258_07035 [Chloroflexi bacterium]|nr:hypothetical protein [Chloroflexota bacterium]
MKVELVQNNAVQTWNGLACGETKVIIVSPQQAYLLRLSVVSISGGLEYVHYTVTIETAP